jgi:hypothetical protein
MTKDEALKKIEELKQYVLEAKNKPLIGDDFIFFRYCKECGLKEPVKPPKLERVEELNLCVPLEWSFDGRDVQQKINELVRFTARQSELIEEILKSNRQG